MTLKPGQSGNLDLLRAVAVSSVFLHHLAQVGWHNEGFRMLGRFGVVLFLFIQAVC